MSSSDRRRRPTQEEREVARQAGQVARQKAKEAAQAARAKAKEAGEAAREEAIEAAFAARREAEAARGRTVAPDAGPFGILWQPEAPASGRGRGRGGSGLNREEIVTAALRVAEAEGPGAVSMRRIAKELGVGTMSLYHHIPTKDDLLDLMTDQVMGELVLPDDPLGDTWQEGLTAISRRTREVYRATPGWSPAPGSARSSARARSPTSKSRSRS